MRIIKLLFIVATLLMFPNLVRAQANPNPGYVLQPSESVFEIPVQNPNEGYGVNVRLSYKDGGFLTNQAGIRYEWIYSGNVISLYDSGFENGCPYDIVSPCPNLHADLRGINPGTAVITIKAYLYDSFIASTIITVKVKDAVYVLKPSEEVINTRVHGQNEGYGVNVLLYKDGYLVRNQSDITYIWKNQSNSFSLGSYGFDSGCPYDIEAPCPNLHADIGGISPGKSLVTVEAWRANRMIASTQFTVIIAGDYRLEWLDQTGSMQLHIDHPFSAFLLHGDTLVQDSQNITYAWSAQPANRVWIRDHISFITSCPKYVSGSCSVPTASIRGLSAGPVEITLKAISRDGKVLASGTLSATVWDGGPMPTPMTEIREDELLETEIYDESLEPRMFEETNWEGERLSTLESNYQALKETVEAQAATIAQQQESLIEQEQGLQETRSLVDRLINYIRQLFRWLR